MQLPVKTNDDVQEQQPIPTAVSESQTPVTPHAPSESTATLPATPSTAIPQSSTQSTATPTQTSSGRPVVPVVPVVPIAKLPQSGSAQPKADTAKPTVPDNEPQPLTNGTQAEITTPEETPKTAAPAHTAPKLWADLVRAKAAASSTNSTAAAPVSGPVPVKNASLGDVLNNLGPDVHHYSDKATFVEPRGLVNTGNMCYMNSVSAISLD